MKTLTEKEALSRMASYCAQSEHCRAEVHDKLIGLGFEIKIINHILDTLEANGYINEERFCSSFIKDKLRLSKWGKLKIAQALYIKKIPNDRIREHLNNIDEKEYIRILQGLIGSKRKNIRGKNEYEVNVKLVRFAMSRGFEMEHIKRCLAIPDN